MNTLDFLIFGLAAWRLAHLLVKEDGPWQMFARLRRRAGIEQIVVHGPEGSTVGWSAKNGLAEGLLCIWCVSVWTACLVVLSALLPTIGCAFIWVSRILAVSAVAIGVQETLAFIRGAE